MLRLHEVEARYGEAAVLHDLSFRVDEGEVVVLLGRNGMGKTSTMRAIMGWSAPQVTDGSLQFDGTELRGLAPHRIATTGLGYVPQGRLVFPSLSVEEHLLVAERANGRASATWTAKGIYELFPQLAGRRGQPAATLSGGEQQMLVIGRALMTNPRLLLLDEPSEGLAPLIVRQVGETVAELRREGISILVAEQDVRFALELADRVLILERGHVVVEGGPEEIAADDDLKRRHLGVETKVPASATAKARLNRGRDGERADTVRAPADDGDSGTRPSPDAPAPAQGPGLLRGTSWHGTLASRGWSPTRGGVHAVVEAATGERLGKLAAAGEHEVVLAAESAAAAQREWAQVSLGARAEVIDAARGLLSQHSTEIADWLIREGGTTRRAATKEVVDAAANALRDAVALAARLEDHQQRGGDSGPSSAVRPIGVGVVGVVTTFRSPLAVAARALAPALVLGNAVLLQPDLRTAVSGGIVLARLLEEAGLPRGLLHVLPGGKEARDALLTDPRVGAVSFIGSPVGGREVAELGGRHLKRVRLDLEGNRVQIVLDDADLERASADGARASFQTGNSPGRHLVHRSIARDYVGLLAKQAASLAVGDPYTGDPDIGPLIDTRQARRTAETLEASVTAGASLRVAGTRYRAFLPPTVLVDVTPDMPVFHEEFSGPIAPVVIVDSEDEAVDIANHAGHGFTSAAVHTGSVERGLAVVDRLRTRQVRINGQALEQRDHVPVGEQAAPEGDHGGWVDQLAIWQQVALPDE